ncbi:MAG: uracil-DNA glycosylase [Candidatus Pacebacteria bacterium]|nr:uracil-DNA glycosylase [Candidatus Paceibacterota bacterium]
MEREEKERYILDMEISDREKQERYEAMKKIRDEVINLKESPLYISRVKPVIGEGSHFSKIIFIGEAPGKNEAETGRPFCGAAGKVLDELLESAGIKRDEIYITNIVKDRPPNNRDPLPEEIKLYAPFLDRQVEIIRPEVIATLGRYSMVYIMERYGLSEMVEPISKARGKIYETSMPYGIVKIVPLYHPAVAVYNRTMIKILKEDFKVLRELI